MLVLAICVACADSPPERGARGVVTLADYFALGEARVKHEFERDPSSPDRVHAALATDCARAVARLRIHFDVQGSSFSTSSATAALIDGGRRAITVGHAALVAVERPDARVELVLSDGRVLAAKPWPLDHYVPGRPATDWAVLDVVDPPPGLHALELGDARAGQRLVLGFPGRFGLDESGRPRIDDVSQHRPLSPLHVLCSAGESSSTELELVAGAVPIGGMSGAPCIDAQGRIVSIQRGVADKVEGDSLRWTLDVVSVDAARAAMAR